MTYQMSRLIAFGVTGICLVTNVLADAKQPWSKYKVHDTLRPRPEKIRDCKAVTTVPPEGATVLFDGKNTDAFTRDWKESFGSCYLHVEWRIPAGRKIDGQKGGNSGIFLMGKYEVQVMESHKNVTYADGQAAAIYGQTPPMFNASAPQGEWQSYDIIFEAPVYDEAGMKTPAYITVIHNGVVVHARQNYYGPTVFRKVASYPATHPEKAPLALQWHGNIWIKELKK